MGCGVADRRIASPPSQIGFQSGARRLNGQLRGRWAWELIVIEGKVGLLGSVLSAR